MADPYQCLRCTTIAIGIYNIIYCLIQFGILGWQVQAVKVIQWEYENRQLPATGAIDGFQARFPGLYAIYTETPERRRINALYAIVLICLGLSVIHLMTTVSMLYGTIKRLSNWIIPWFFTCAPMVIMCTAYAVLWWSGDVFNEQLTMSVAEFVMSLAINGVCFIIVILYFLRITGRLTSDRPESSGFYGNGPHYNRKYDHYRSDELPIIEQSHHNFSKQQQQSQQQRSQRRPYSAPNYNSKVSKSCTEPKGDLPPWHETMPSTPSYGLRKKLRRRARDRSLSPTAALRQGYRGPTIANPASLRRRNHSDGGINSQHFQLPTPYDNSGFVSQVSSPRFLKPTSLSTRSRTSSAPNGRRSGGGGTVAPVQPLPSSTHGRASIKSSVYSSPKKNKFMPPTTYQPKPPLPTTTPALRRKSPQRVSFTRTRPKVYERTPDSSLSGGYRNGSDNIRHSEIHTVV